MSYVKIVNYAAKDALVTADPAKLIKGTEMGAEFDAVAAASTVSDDAIALRATIASPTLTGTPVAPTATANTNTTQIATTAHVFAERANTATLANKTVNLTSNTLIATSAQIAAAVTDETGTGALVFAGSPALTGTATLANQETSGTATFAAVVINGTLDMNAGSGATVTGLSTPVQSTDAATKAYVDTSISNLIGAAPGALDTLVEIATSLGNNATLSATLISSIATKLTKAGDTMSGILDMGANKITNLPTPTAGNDAVRLTYVTDLFGSTASAEASATSATSSASTATTQAGNALTSANNAAASYDQFDDRYLGSKGSAPTQDNDSQPLLTGALYFDTALNRLRVYDGAAWQTTVTTAAGVSSLDGQAGDLVTNTINGAEIIGTGNLVTAILGANTFTSLQNFAAGADIASATTVNLTTATGNTVVITGTTTTTGFTMVDGQQMMLLPSGAWPITFHATTANINGGASYTCAAGDRVYVVRDLADVIRVSVVKQDGTAVVSSSGTPAVVLVTATTATAVKDTHITFSNAALTTITLPLNPASGDPVWITSANALTTNVVARNGQTIMDLAEDMTLNVVRARVQLRFTHSSWRLVA